MFVATVVCGPPAAGKSEYVEMLLDIRRSQGEFPQLISIDQMCGLVVVGRTPYYTSIDGTARRWDLDEIDEETLQRAEIIARTSLSAARFYTSEAIVEGLFHTAESRKRLIGNLVGLPNVKLFCDWATFGVMQDDEAITRELLIRNRRRVVRVPDSVVIKTVGAMETPTIDEGWTGITMRDYS